MALDERTLEARPFEPRAHGRRDADPAPPPLADALARVRRPIGEARGLPSELYLDEDAFARERERVFARGWAALAFEADAPAPGDVAPVDFLGFPLLLVRDKAGELRVFHNVCRHRGVVLVEEPRRASVIRCPYHAWTYALDGRLRATPHVGGPGVHAHAAICAATHSLVPVRSARLFGTVFVNLSGDAAPFEEYAAPLVRRWADFAGRALHFGGPESAFTLDVETNWKLAVENYCESYHLPFVHPELNKVSRLEDHFNVEEPGAFSGQGSRAYTAARDLDGQRFSDFKRLPATWDKGAEYLALYPNLLLGVHRDHVFAMRLEPRGPGRTREHVAIFYAGEADTGPDLFPLRQKNAATWRQVFEEDVGIVEAMQRGRRAPGFDGGAFSPVMDGPTHCFHAWVAERMAEA